MSGGCRQCFIKYSQYAGFLFVLDCGLDVMKKEKLSQNRIATNAVLCATWPISVPLVCYIVGKSLWTGKKFSFEGKWTWTETGVEEKEKKD